MAIELSPEQWLTKVNKKTWGDIDTRWQTDEDLYNLTPYSWPTDEGKIVKSRDCVTLNDPRSYADRVKDTLIYSAQSRAVEDGLYTKVRDEQRNEVETFLDFNLEAADERLNRAEILPLRSGLSGQFTVRGRSVARVLVMVQGDKYIPDIQWYDARYVKYATNKDGLAWCATVMTMTAEAIEYDYQLTITSDTAEVIDLWTPQWEYVWVGGSLINNKAFPFNHKLGYVPFVIQVVPTGGFLQSTGFEQYIGESVYAPVRNLYAVLNKLLTMEMTYSRLCVEGAYQYESSDPNQVMGKVAADGYPLEPGKVTLVEKGGGYRLIQVPDIKQATMHAITTIESRIQRATLPFIDYGQTPFELSGSAMMMVKGAGDVIYAPRLWAKEKMMTAICMMFNKQYKAGGVPFDLSETVHYYKYTKKDLPDDYTLKISYTPKLPEKEIANFSRADMAKRLGVSQDTIFNDFLELQNPSGEKRKMLMERARDAIPALWMKEAAIGEVENDGDNKDAEIIASMMKVTLKQLIEGKIAGAPPPEKPAGNGQQSPIFGQGVARPAQMPVMPQQKEAAVV